MRPQGGCEDPPPSASPATPSRHSGFCKWYNPAKGESAVRRAEGAQGALRGDNDGG